MIITKLFDDGDNVTYTLLFSNEDAERILCLSENQQVELPSIEGSIMIKKSKASIIYKNGRSEHGTIYTDYKKLRQQLLFPEIVENAEN